MRTPKDKPNKRYLLAILALCLIVRVIIVLAAGEVKLANDAVAYSSLAKSILKDHIFGSYGIPCAGRDPLYPCFLAGIYSIFGESNLAIRLLQAVLDTVNCFLVFVIASRLGLARRAGLIAAALFAVFPGFIISANSVLTETLAAFLALLAVYLLITLRDRGKYSWVWPGIVCGLIILNKGSLLFFPISIAVVAFLGRRSIRQWLWKATLLVVVSYAVVSPWTIRNYAVLGGFAPTNTYGWSTIWAGTGIADGKTLSWWSDPIVISGSPEAKNTKWISVSKATYDEICFQRDPTKKMSPMDCERHLRPYAIKQITEHPVTFAYMGLKKFVRLWFNLWHEKAPSQRSLAYAAYNALMIALAAVGYARWKAVVEAKRFMFAYAIVATFSSMIGLSDARQGFPMWSFVFILAAVPLAAYSERLKATRKASHGG